MEDPQFETLGTGPVTAVNPISILRVLSRHHFDWLDMQGILERATYDARDSDPIIAVVPSIVCANNASKRFFCTLQGLYHSSICLRAQVLMRHIVLTPRLRSGPSASSARAKSS